MSERTTALDARTTHQALYGSLLAPLRLCACGTIFSHHDSPSCSTCAGRHCTFCGRPKQPAPATCGARECDRRKRAEDRRAAERENVAPVISTPARFVKGGPR